MGSDWSDAVPEGVARGGLPGVVIECVGVAGMIQHAADVAAIDGRVTIVGVCLTNDQVTPFTALQKELTTQYVLYYRKADFRRTIETLHAGRIDPRPLITDSISLDDLPERFEALKHPTDDAKLIVEP